MELFVILLGILVVAVVVRQGRALRDLRDGLAILESRVLRVEGSPGAGPVVPPAPALDVDGPAATPGAIASEPEPAAIPFSMPAPPPAPVPAPSPSPERQTPAAFLPATPVASMSAAPPEDAARPARGDHSRLEEVVGSVWLQNAGAVLVLLGVFFLILWGYTTGRFGPGVLVAAGAALGLTLVWRGDRVARSLPPFGHALIGVGLGTVYLSLYLGHFTLRVLPPAVALVSLTLVAIGSVLVGLRYRVQTIAAIGVLGAFVPQLMAAWIPLQGFAMSAPGMLGYLAAVDVVVFLLAARAGWSRLDLACLFLSAVTWIAQFHDAWSWPVQMGLSVLFTGLGLSPLPRLAAREGTVRAIDLAVIALAPLCLIATSWPMLSSATRGTSAMLLLALAAIYVAAALWADARRPERDLWRPLTGAATLFVTAALERALGREYTGMAWCLEGTLLMWLGLRPRGGWLRACGYAVLGLGVYMMLLAGLAPGDWLPGQWPGFYADGVRDLVCIVATLGAAWLMARDRGHLAFKERYAPELWTAVGNLLLLIWTGREAMHLGLALEGEGGRWAHAPNFERVNAVGISALGLFWMIQSAVLVAMSRQPERRFMRACGYATGALAGLGVLISLCAPDGWSSGGIPVLYTSGLIQLASIALMAAVAAALARRRERLSAVSQERYAPELWTALVNLLIVFWAGREAMHLALALEGEGGRWAHARAPLAPTGFERVNTVGIAAMGLFWMIQSAVLMAKSRLAGRGFLRVCGYATGAVAGLATFISLCVADGWSSDQIPALHTTGLIRLASIALMASVAALLVRRRDVLTKNEARMPEVVTLAASLLLLGWTASEADHLARTVVGIPGVFADTVRQVGREALRRSGILAASFTSAGWLLEALVLLALGWVRHSAFLRWSGLVLTGITVIKFLLLDLQNVDVFWRFLTAIVVGAALLAVSYAYQRRARGTKAGG